MANNNFFLSSEIENMISKKTHIVPPENGRATAPKAKVIEKLIEIGYKAHEHLDDESFEQVMGFKK